MYNDQLLLFCFKGKYCYTGSALTTETLGAGGNGSEAVRNAYHGPLAASVVLKSGYIADTHDVTAAKGAHYVALSLASQHGGHH